MYQNIFYRKKVVRPRAAFFCLHEKFSCDIITAWTMDLRCSTFSFLIQNQQHVGSTPACRFITRLHTTIVFFRVNSFGMLESIFAGSDSGRKRCIEKNAPFLFARLNPVCYNIQVLRTFNTHKEKNFLS